MSDDVFLKFDPRQPRAKNGEWSKIPGTSGKAKGMSTRSATQSPESVRAAGVAGGGHAADAVVEDQADQMAAETRKAGKEHGMLVGGDGTVLAEVQGQKSSIFVEEGVAFQVRNVEGREQYSITTQGKLTAVHSHPNATGPSTRDVEDLGEKSRVLRASTVVTSHGDVIRMEPGGNVMGTAALHKRLMKQNNDNIAETTMKGDFGGPPTIQTGHMVRANTAIDVPRHEAWVVGTHAALVRATAGGGVKVTVKLTPKTKELVQRVKARNPDLYAKMVGESQKTRWKDLGYDPD